MAGSEIMAGPTPPRPWRPDAPDRHLGRAGGPLDLRLGPAEVEAADRAEGPEVDQRDGGALLGLVGRERDVGGRLDLEDVEVLSGQQHRAQTRDVDHLGVVRVRLVDDLRAQDLGLRAIGELHAQRLEHRVAGVLHVGLGVGVELEDAEVALDDHQAGADVGRLDGGVGHLVDQHAGSDLDHVDAIPGTGR